MSTNNIQEYKEIFKLDAASEFVKIDHEDAMVATVYKIFQPNKSPLILKVCKRPYDYSSEIYFLNYFSNKIPCPNIIDSIQLHKENCGAILMEYFPGDLLKPNAITKEVAFEIGKILALIHKNKTDKFGYLNRDANLVLHPDVHFTEKFEEGLEECKSHLPKQLITQTYNYFQEYLPLLKSVDGPCMIHRDFRPGNIIIENNKLQGIIDWSSARASFAEDDFCSIEHGEWGNFNGYKKNFLAGYSSTRTIPNYHKIMPLLRLNRAIAVIGFTVKCKTWNTVHTKAYRFNRDFIDNFFIQSKH